MGTKYTPVYEDDAADLGRGIPEQTDEEAANEAAMQSKTDKTQYYPANSAVNKKGQLLRDDEVASSMKATLDQQLAKRNLRDDPVTQSMEDTLNRQLSEKTPTVKRTPIVTKEQLAASGLSLRDYLNKQQGLTRRGDSAPSASPSKATTPPGSSLPPSRALMPNKEGQPGGSLPVKRPRGQGTVMEQGRGADIYGGSINDFRDMFKGTKRGGGDYAKGGAVKKMAAGGSVSSASKRADGIAQRGKTKGKMC
jgi:hypothetical protein